MNIFKILSSADYDNQTYKLIVLPLVGIVFMLCSQMALADQFYVTVGIDCRKSKSDAELEVWFHGHWNEAGEKAIASLDKNGFDPRKFVSFVLNSDEKYSIHTKTESRICVLGKQKYAIELSPMMAPRFQPEGMCAARIGANAIIKLGNKIVAFGGVDACTETGQVTTRIIIKPNQPTTYQKISAEEFYQLIRHPS
jgi:hypothetical protein